MVIMKNNKKFGRLFIEINGTLTDISELEKDDYKDKSKKDDKYIKL